MSGDSDLQLNIVENVFSSRAGDRGSKTKKFSRNDRLQKKKAERRAILQNSASPKTDSSSAEISKVPTNVSLSNGDDDTSSGPKKKIQKVGKDSSLSSTSSSRGHSTKFSSLFKNNPAIPQLENTQVQSVAESVFSTDLFSSFPLLHPFMVSNLESHGFSKATAVQKRVIPEVLAGKDVLVKSQTGSGKTLAYGIPLVEMLRAQTPRVERCHGAYAVVIVPTRELALQTCATFVKLIKPWHYIVPGCVMGGENRGKEKARLRKGVNVLVATPGRLLDHLTHTASLTLTRARWLVVDEADRLLELGFEKAVAQIVSLLHERGPSQRQTVLLSATLSEGVERLAGISLSQPSRVHLSGGQDAHKAGAVTSSYATPASLRHHFLVAPSKLRLVTLTAFILWKCRHGTQGKMVVFMATQDGVDFHHSLLDALLNRRDTADVLQSGDDEEDASVAESRVSQVTVTSPISSSDVIPLYKLHGDMEQKDRTRIFTEYAAAESGVLLCTDVAARGLDLPRVAWIVQYTAPASAEDYVHRAGRTARRGCGGQAVLFLTPAESSYVNTLNTHSISLTEVTVEEVLQTLLLEEGLVLGHGQRARTAQERATALQMRVEELCLHTAALRRLARRAYQSYVRAYTAYPAALKPVCNIRNLHLGHVAKSFGLQEAPTRIGGIVGKFAKVDAKRAHKKGKRSAGGERPTGKRRHTVKALALSEFSSGLDTSRFPSHHSVDKPATGGTASSVDKPATGGTASRPVKKKTKAKKNVKRLKKKR